jgi:hypothetical protein
VATFREKVIGLARSLNISREDFTVGPFIDWPGIQKRIEERFVIKTSSDLQPGNWPEHFKGKRQLIKSRTYEPFEYLDELVNDNEKIWLILVDSSAETAKLWLFQGYVRPIQKMLGQLKGFSYYLIAKKYEWLLFNDQTNHFVALGELKKAIG